MTANDSKSYLSYLKNLVDQYNNTCHNFIGKKSTNGDYKAPNFKVNHRVRITKHKNIFSKRNIYYRFCF